MKTWVALLRGINVGGKTTLPMKELVAMLKGMGARGVKTYVQSGNAVFRGTAANRAQISERLASEIRRH